MKQNWPEGSNLKIYQIGIKTQCESWKDTEVAYSVQFLGKLER